MKVSGLTEKVAKALATAEELARVEAGENMVVYMTVANIDATVSKRDMKLVTKALAKGAKVAQYLDLSMFKKIGNDPAIRLTDLNGHKVTVTITVPKAFRAPKGVDRTFYIVRVHDGKAKVIGSGNGNKVEAKTDLFSTYALTYKDEVKPTTAPTTAPTAKPTTAPTVKPTAKPTTAPVDPDFTLLARMTVSGDSKSALKLAWTKVRDAYAYDVYFAKCGKEFKLKKTVKASESCVVRFKGLDERESYKAYVRAWKMVNDKKVYIGKASPQVHAITGGYDAKNCNTRSVTLNKSSLTLKVGKSKTVKATLKGVKSGKTIMQHVQKVRWYSTNVNVAKVNKNGKVTAVGKGSCTIYAIANNGVRNSVKVKVK